MCVRLIGWEFLEARLGFLLQSNAPLDREADVWSAFRKFGGIHPHCRSTVQLESQCSKVDCTE